MARQAQDTAWGSLFPAAFRIGLPAATAWALNGVGRIAPQFYQDWQASGIADQTVLCPRPGIRPASRDHAGKSLWMARVNRAATFQPLPSSFPGSLLTVKLGNLGIAGRGPENSRVLCLAANVSVSLDNCCKPEQGKPVSKPFAGNYGRSQEVR